MKRIILITLLMCLYTLSHAEVRLGGGVFSYEPSGSLRDSSSVSDALDLKNDLHLKDDDGSFVFIYLEHPIPVLPNIRFGNTSMDLGGSGQTTLNFNYNGIPFTDTDDITTKLDLSHTELALYWEIWDTGFDFDLGLNVKFFDGDASLTRASGADSSAKLDATIPLLYGSLYFPLADTGFSLGVEGSVISYDGNSISDYIASVRYRSEYAFGVEAGVRSFNLDYEDTTDQQYVDVEVSGAFAQVFLFF